MSIRATLNDKPWFHVIEIRPMPRAKVIEHPVEDGTVIVDNKVIEPLKVQVRGYVYDYYFEEAYKELKGFLNNRDGSKFWYITSRFPTGSGSINGEYDDLVLTAMPHRESPDHLDCTEFTLEFTQLMLGHAQSTVSDPGNASRTSV